MPSHLHEALIELFRHRPALAAELLAGPLGMEVPPHRQARLESGELTDLTPTEYRADAVVTLTGAARRPVLAVVVEVQLSRDAGKRRSWPVYLATLHARLRCPVVLLVVCPEAALASWCAAPIRLGPGFVLHPLALGPDRVPVVTDPAQAGDSPELAVLSAMAHGTHPERDKVFQALLGAMQTVDHDHANLYTDVVLGALPAAARHRLEAMMPIGTYEYQSDFARRYYGQGRAEGEAEGEAKAVLAVLAARGIEVPEAARARIAGCTDLDQLDTWVRRAATATSVQDLFD